MCILAFSVQCMEINYPFARSIANFVKFWTLLCSVNSCKLINRHFVDYNSFVWLVFYICTEMTHHGAKCKYNLEIEKKAQSACSPVRKLIAETGLWLNYVILLTESRFQGFAWSSSPFSLNAFASNLWRCRFYMYALYFDDLALYEKVLKLKERVNLIWVLVLNYGYGAKQAVGRHSNGVSTCSTSLAWYLENLRISRISVLRWILLGLEYGWGAKHTSVLYHCTIT